MTRTLLSEYVAEKIKGMVISGTFISGQKIPNEMEMVELLNVSRGTIREAIKILVSQNVLEIQRGKGTFVTAMPGLNTDPFGMAFIPSDQLQVEILEIRSILEPSVGMLAASRANPKDILLLEDAAYSMQPLLDRWAATDSDDILASVADTDMRFHTTLYKCCHNALLERMLPCLNRGLLESFSDEKFRTYYKKFYKSNTHVQIYEAVKNQDTELAEELCRRHIKVPLALARGIEKDITEMC